MCDYFDDFGDLLSLVKSHPDCWMLTFKKDDEVILEYFGRDYRGKMEPGSGDWAVVGILQDAIAEAKKNLKA